MWWVTNNFCLSEKKFLSNLFQEGRTYLKVQILSLGMSFMIDALNLGRLASYWKNGQLFCKHSLL